MIYQQYMGKFSLTASMNDFTLDDGGGADAVALTAADYFIQGYTGEASDQLCEHMQTKIRALGAPYAGATVVFAPATQKITLTFNSGGTVTIGWTDAALQSLLGFSGTQSGADTYTATNRARYCWSPSVCPSDYPGDLPTIWLPDSTSMMTMSADGSLVSTTGNLLYGSAILYEALDREEVVSDSSTVWESYQAFWLDVVHNGMPMRVYPDKTLNTSGDYVEGRMVPPDADMVQEDVVTIGPLPKYISREQPGFNGIWRVAFRLAKEV